MRTGTNLKAEATGTFWKARGGYGKAEHRSEFSGLPTFSWLKPRGAQDNFGPHISQSDW